MTKKIYSFILLLFVAVFSTVSVNAQYISSFAGNGTGAGTSTGGYGGDGGMAANAQLNACTGVAVDGAGNIYIADRGNNVVRKVNTAGVISTFAGTGVAGMSGDGGAAGMAKLNAPIAVTTDAAGNVYIADNGNHLIRVVNLAGIINTIAGVGAPGYSGDWGNANAAALNNPQGMAFDGAGNLYIADAGNNVIRMINTSNMITTYAGNNMQGNSGDGGMATAAKLHGPSSVATDVYGNLYIADYYNNVIRRVSAAGIITRIAGTGTAGNGGDGGLAVNALLNYPASVSVDGAGTIYVVDQGNNNLRKISPTGVISHLAGTSTNGYSGNGGLAATAKLASPKCVLADGWGRVYVADYNNHVVRVITATAPTTSVKEIAANGGMNIYPNPSNGVFTIDLPEHVNATQVVITDIKGKVAGTKNITGAIKSQQLDFSTLSPGVYVVTVNAGANTYTAKLEVAGK